MEIVNHSSIEQLNNPLKPVGLPDNRFADPHIKIFTNPDSGRQAMYIYVGHDEGKGEFIMRNWYVLWSEDLIHWNAKVSLDRKDTFMDPESVNCWACDCVQSPFDNRFYLYYSNGRDSTGVAVSDRPDGPFTDARGKTPLLTANEQIPCAYDPDIILPDKDDPNAYIVFCGSWQAPYWSMQLKQNMTEVVPGTLRRVYVYPADGTPEELTGELRSDQPEAFRYGDTWYMYWAGRYATGRNRLGPAMRHAARSGRTDAGHSRPAGLRLPDRIRPGARLRRLYERRCFRRTLGRCALGAGAVRLLAKRRWKYGGTLLFRCP